MKELIKKLRAGCEGIDCEKCEYGYKDGGGCNITGIAADVMEDMLIELEWLREICKNQQKLNRDLVDAVLGGKDEKVQ